VVVTENESEKRMLDRSVGLLTNQEIWIQGEQKRTGTACCICFSIW